MFNTIKLFLLSLVFLFNPLFITQALAKAGGADIAVGGGVNAFTGGRNVPSIELSYATSDQVFAWAATGVKSKYSYQSSHMLMYFRTWTAGTMWGGEVTAGFGGGAGYSVRGFQDVNATSETTAQDVLAGPATRLNWSYGPVYLNLSTIFGLRDIQKHLLGLNFQNVESLTLGFRF